MSEKSDEFIEFLRRSREQIGEEEPVLLTEDGRVIDGKHRLAAYPGWRKRVVDLTPKQALIKRIHRTLKSKVTRKERKAQLLELALYLEDEGVKKDDVIQELTKLVPFSEDYIRRLLPKKYKREYLKARKLTRKPRIRTESQIKPEAGIVTKVSKPKPKPLECPNCHVELSKVLCPHCWTEIELKR